MSVENVAVLFTDIVGSTPLAAAVGPARADELRRRHFGLLRRAIRASGGQEVKNVGDGVMAVFRAASAALSCAVAMQQAVERDGREDVPVGLRVGLSAGEVEAEDGDYFGEPVVEAARLCARCASGQILAADIVRLMAGRRSAQECRPLGELDLKGLPQPVAAVEVRWEPLGAHRLTPLPARVAVRPPVGVVGRSAELALVAEGVKRVAADGRCEVIVVAGEAGVGKTTLISEGARLAFEGGACVLFGHCEEDLAAPYQLFGEALGHLVDHLPDDELAALIGDEGPSLAPLLTGLARRLVGRVPPTTADADAGRYQLFAAVVDLLANLSERQPIVLVLEDLQWADRASLQLLRHVVGADRSQRLLVVGTCRDSELSRAHPMAETLAELHRLGGVTRLDLHGLDDAGVAAFIEAAAGQALDEAATALASELHRETGGNPFFVGELLRHLVDTGAIARDETGDWSAAVPLDEVNLPPSVHAVVGGRVGRLGGDAERVLSLAAVIGRDFDLDLLVGASGLADDDVLAILDAATTSALVRELPDAAGCYSFVHALIRRILYDQLGPTRRARAHRRVAIALEALCGDRRGSRVGELARHWSAAPGPDALAKALDYTRRAADDALAALAPGDAASAYARALDLNQQCVEPDPRLDLDLRIGFGIAQRQAGEAGFRETLLAAARQAIELGDTDRLAAAAAANHREMFSVAGRIDHERIEILELTLQRVPTEHPARAVLLAILCSELTYGSDLEQRQALADEAIALARARGDDATLVRVLNDLAYPIAVPQLLVQAMERSAEALKRAERLGDPIQWWRSADHRSVLAIMAGDVAEMERCCAVAWSLAERLDLPYFQWQRALMRAHNALLAGDTSEAAAHAVEARNIGSRSGQPDAELIFGGQMAGVNRQRGVFRPDAIVALQRTCERHPGLGDVTTAMQAHEHARIGQLDVAQQLLDDFAARGFEPRQWDPANALVTVILYTDVVLACGDREATAGMYERLLPYADQIATDGSTPHSPVRLHLGRLATMLRSFEEADDHFARAAAFAERARSKYFAAEIDLAWGQMFLARGTDGDEQRARAHLASAREAAVARGYADVDRRARGALQRL